MSLKRSPVWRSVALSICMLGSVVLGCGENGGGGTGGSGAGGMGGTGGTGGGMGGTGGGMGGTGGSMGGTGGSMGGMGGTGGGTDVGPAIRSFRATPRGLLPGGGMATLTWDVSGAETITIDNGIGVVTGNETTVAVTETTAFTITATNTDGANTRRTGVLVSTGEPAPFARHGVTTSVDKIEADETTGAIDELTALRYKVFALFGDPRLPDEYQADGRIHGTRVMKELARRFDTLPQGVQDELQPFRLPPDDPNSWRPWAGAGQGLRQKGPATIESITVANNQVRLAYPSTLGITEQILIEQVLSLVAELAFQDLHELMGRPPLSHRAGQPFLIYIDEFGENGDYGTTHGTYDAAAGGYRSYLTINLSETGSAETDLAAATVAHELMHAFQNAFDTVDTGTQALDWLEESTATWAEDHVFPLYNTEHEYATELLHRPDLSVDNLNGTHEYAGYLFHLFIDRQFGPDPIGTMWELSELSEVFVAVGGALSEPLETLWPRFVAYNWNWEPLFFHEQWDALLDSVKEDTDRMPVEITAKQKMVEMELLAGGSGNPTQGVDYLSAQYFHYDLTDTSLHSVLFANGYTFNLQQGTPDIASTDETLFATEVSPVDRDGASVQLLVKANGQWMSEPQDVTDVAFIPFCQDMAEERVQELVVIFSNSRYFSASDRTPVVVQGMQPRLFVSNMACGDWVGSATTTVSRDEPNTQENTVTSFDNLLFSRERLSLAGLLAGEGEANLLGTLVPDDVSSFNFGRYSIEIVDVTWNLFRERNTGSDICTWLGSGMLDASNVDTIVSFMQMRPSLVAPTASPASVYRSYSVSLAIGAPGTPVTRTCTSGASSVTTFTTGLVGGLRNTPIGLFEITDDGIEINNSWTDDEITYEFQMLGISD